MQADLLLLFGVLGAGKATVSKMVMMVMMMMMTMMMVVVMMLRMMMMRMMMIFRMQLKAKSRVSSYSECKNSDHHNDNNIHDSSKRNIKKQ